MSNGADGFWKFAPWLFFLLGLVLIAVAYFAIDVKTHESWHAFIISAGSLLLSAGVFAILLKSFQYIQVFREELFKIFEDEKFEFLLRKIMHGEHADDDARLRAFEHATNQYLSNKPEPLRKQLADALIGSLKWADCDGYYRAFVRTIRIKGYDSENQQINLEDEVFVELIPKDTTAKIRYAASVAKTAGDINGQLVVNGVDLSKEMKVEGGNIQYELMLEGSESYRIDRKYNKTYRLSMDPYMHLRLARHALTLRLKIENDVADKIEVIVKPCGFDPSPKAGGWRIEETNISDTQGLKVSILATKTSLTFPEDGYIIILYEKK